MGSVRFEGVQFAMFSDDHLPPHAHARYGEVRIIVDLLTDMRGVALSGRTSKQQRGRASSSDIKHILDTAAEHYDEIVAVWRLIHD